MTGGQDFLAGYAADRPDKPAVIVERTDGSVVTTSYRQFNADVNRLAAAMLETGVQPGDRVIWSGRNSAEVLRMQHAARKVRAVSVPLNHRLARPEARWIVENSGAVFAWIAADHRDLLAGLPAELATLRRVVVFGGEALGDQRPAADAVDPLPDTEPDVDASVEVAATVIYTSGTTGRPKGAVRALLTSPEQRAHMAAFMAAMHVGEGEDVYLPTGSMSHGGPLSFADLVIAQGNTVILLERFDAETWLRLLDTYQANLSYSAPAPMRFVCGLPADVKEKYDRTSLRTMLAAAAAWPFALKLAYLEDFAEDSLWEVYGSTELGINTILRPQDQRRKPGSCGQAAPGVQVVLVDDDGREITEPHVPGLLYVRGGSSFTTYLGDQRKYEAEHLGDAHTVGDVAYRDEEGYYYICDRRKDLVITGGANVYPAEVEAAVESVPGVFECAVLGLPDETWGERVHACLVVDDPEHWSLEAFTAACRERLANYKVPRTVELFDELPHMTSGKIDKMALRHRYGVGPEGPPADATSDGAGVSGGA